MNLIPDINLFIVTSSLKPNMGAYSDGDRFNQTIDSLKSLREKVPEAIVLFTDCSARPVSDLEKQAISKYSNFYFDLSSQPNCKYCVDNALKSPGENSLLFFTLLSLKQNPQISPLLNQVKRIFKFSARTILEEDFDIKEYDGLFGKFVFKKRIPTWLNQAPLDTDHLFITRLYSFCPSLIDIYQEVIQKNLNSLQNGVPDTEHAHYANIPKQYLVEFDKLHCWGWLAGNGQIEHY